MRKTRDDGYEGLRLFVRGLRRNDLGIVPKT